MPTNLLFRVTAESSYVKTESMSERGCAFSGPLLLCRRPADDRWIQPHRDNILHQVNFVDGRMTSVDTTPADFIQVIVGDTTPSAATDAPSSSSSLSSSSSAASSASSSLRMFTIPTSSVAAAASGKLVFYQPWQIALTPEYEASEQQYRKVDQKRLLGWYDITPERLESARQKLLAQPSGILCETIDVLAARKALRVSSSVPAATSASSSSSSTSSEQHILHVCCTVIFDDLGYRLHGEYAEK